MFCTMLPADIFQQIGIPASGDEGFKIVVKGVTGSYANGWIVLDDLYTHTDYCSTHPPDASLAPPVTTAAPGHHACLHNCHCIVTSFSFI